jgi:hypothetical protein
MGDIERLSGNESGGDDVLLNTAPVKGVSPS